MLRITRLTDYAFTLLTHFAMASEDAVFTAAELADMTRLPVPTVTKLLKLLAKAEILASHRGASGGYNLVSHPEEITVGRIIAALDGPIAITDCLTGEANRCDYEPMCPTSGVWERINGAVRGALEQITLEEISRSITGQSAYHHQKTTSPCIEV